MKLLTESRVFCDFRDGKMVSFFYTDFTDFTEGKRASLMIPVRKYSILGDFNEGRRCF